MKELPSLAGLTLRNSELPSAEALGYCRQQAFAVSAWPNQGEFVAIDHAWIPFPL